MCKYCELKNGESICLTNRKHDDLYISKVEDEYYIENEGLTKFKLNYCPICGRDLQNELSKIISPSLLYVLINHSHTKRGLCVGCNNCCLLPVS